MSEKERLIRTGMTAEEADAELADIKREQDAEARAMADIAAFYAAYVIKNDVAAI